MLDGPPDQFGTAARSYTDVRAPNFANESFGLMRRMKLTEKVELMLRGEFFNALNRVVFGVPVANVSAANFGRVTSQSNSPRQGQVAARARSPWDLFISVWPLRPVPK